VIDWDGFRRRAIELEGGMFLAGLSFLRASRSALEAEAVAAAEAFCSGLADAADDWALSWYRATRSRGSPSTAATKPAGTSARAALIQEGRVLVAEL
jgi:hypothetical protein